MFDFKPRDESELCDCSSSRCVSNCRVITAVPGLLESIGRYNVGFSASKELKALVPLLASTESLCISGGQKSSPGHRCLGLSVH